MLLVAKVHDGSMAGDFIPFDSMGFWVGRPYTECRMGWTLFSKRLCVLIVKGSSMRRGG